MEPIMQKTNIHVSKASQQAGPKLHMWIVDFYMYTTSFAQDTLLFIAYRQSTKRLRVVRFEAGWNYRQPVERSLDCIMVVRSKTWWSNEPEATVFV